MTDKIAPKPSPMHDSRKPFHRTRVVLFFLFVAFFGGVLAHWFIAGGLALQSTSKPGASGDVIRCSQGPWGELECVPITLSAPEEILAVRGSESLPTRWVFGKITDEQFVKLINSFDLSAGQKDQFLNPGARENTQDGVVVTVPDEVLIDLNPEVRRRMYQYLGTISQNDFLFIPKELVAERFDRSGVLSNTRALFEKLSVISGNYQVFFGTGCVLRHIPTYEEKVQFAKVLSRQRSYVVRLHLTPQSNIQELTNYWGRATWLMDVRSFLESFSVAKGGEWLDLIELLPPLPSSLLYTYPVPLNPMKGPVYPRDCFWTALNFFKDVPGDTLYGENLKKCLEDDYHPAETDPRYGDVMLLSMPDGKIVHFAVYIADGLVFTKNGDTSIHPWIFSTVKEVVEQYSHVMPAGQKLRVDYYRNKYY